MLPALAEARRVSLRTCFHSLLPLLNLVVADAVAVEAVAVAGVDDANLI